MFLTFSASTNESEVDVAALQKRLEDTEKAMQRMMDMMNNMGVAMNQVTKQLCGKFGRNMSFCDYPFIKLGALPKCQYTGN